MTIIRFWQLYYPERKLGSAVTYVLVKDSTRGYGIFIENMIEAAK